MHFYLSYSNNFSRFEGFILLTIFLFYMYILLKRFTRDNSFLDEGQKKYLNISTNLFGLKIFRDINLIKSFLNRFNQNSLFIESSYASIEQLVNLYRVYNIEGEERNNIRMKQEVNLLQEKIKGVNKECFFKTLEHIYKTYNNIYY